MSQLTVRDHIIAELSAGTKALGLTLSVHQHQQLADYLQLLDNWNRIYNLTAVRDIHAMVARHVLDSLTLVPYVNRSPVLDIGSGAGLPGIPLAIALPQYRFVLVECQQKRTRFLQQTVTSVALTNVDIVAQRVEHYQPDHEFAVITARAVASCTQLVNASTHLLAQAGQWLLLKGAVTAAEYAGLPENTRLDAIIGLTVPGVQQQRQLVRVTKA